MNILKSRYFELEKLSKPDKYNNQYLDGKFHFIKLNSSLDIQFQLLNEDETNNIDFDVIENIFGEFVAKFDSAYLENLIHQIIKHLSSNIAEHKREKEIERLKHSLQLDYIVFSFTRVFDCFLEDDEKNYSEKFAIVLRLLDNGFEDYHEIVSEIDIDDFTIKDAYFEAI